MFLARKTVRTKVETNANDYIDIALSVMILVWLEQRIFLGIFDGANNY
jgi:hypothetical protein